MGDATGAGTTRVAHRVLGDGDGVSGRELRPARRRRRPDVSAPRERDCPVRVGDAPDICTALVPRAVFAGGRPENVEVGGELLYAAGFVAARVQSFGDSDAADFGALWKAAELHLRRTGGGDGCGGEAADIPGPDREDEVAGSAGGG